MDVRSTFHGEELTLATIKSETFEDKRSVRESLHKHATTRYITGVGVGLEKNDET